MATVLNDFSWGRAARTDRFPWLEWFDGQARMLKRGEDFTNRVSTMQATIYTAAKRHGVAIRTQLDHDAGTLVLQAVGRLDKP